MAGRLESVRQESEEMTISVLIYYFAFGLYIFVYGLSRTNFERFLVADAKALVDIGRILCVLMLIGKLFAQKYRWRHILAIMVVGIVTAISLYTTRDWNLPLLFLFIIAGQGVSLRKLAAIALPIQVGLLLLTVTFANAGLIESIYRYRTIDEVPQLRSSLGYVHPNSFGQSLLSVCVSIAILRFRRFNFFDLLLYMASLFACSQYADSRTSTLCIVFVILCSAVVCVVQNERGLGLLSRIAFLMAFGAASFSLIMMLFYSWDVPWMRGVNSLLSSRFSLAHAYYLEYPPRLFGYESDAVTMFISYYYTQHNPDNAYVRMLIVDGVLPAIIFFSLYLSTLGLFAKRACMDASVFGLLVFAVAAVMESYSLSFAANYCLIGMTALIYGWDQYLEANHEAPPMAAQDDPPQRKLLNRHPH